MLILGMGNPILSDDGVGLSIAKLLQTRINGADVAYSAMIGLNLLDLILDYKMVFIIDAMTSSTSVIGKLSKISADGRSGTLHLFSSHGLNIFDLVEFGALCGLEMPILGAVYGIEIGSEVAFGEDISPALSEKLPAIAEEIIADMISVLPALSALIPMSADTVRQ
jgi:hydrogenase maturation protease